MTKKKVAAFFTAAALCGALAVGSSMAYLTDHDSVTNKLEKMMLMYIWMFLSRLQR